MSTESFYEQLPPIDRFTDLSDASVYSALPDDWFVAVSDIKDSTTMISMGKYKAVNLIGASTIMAILNLKKSFSVPFMFGGDGAAICIPEPMVAQTKAALLATRNLARDLYSIDLRIGIIPVSFIRKQGYDVLVARSRLSTTFSQAAFSGGGVQFAEECLKDPHHASDFGIEEGTVTAAGDFTGLECRWENIPSAHDEIVSLIVQAVGKNIEDRSAVYRDIIARISAVYGEDDRCHPVQEELLAMTMRERNLSGESGIRSYSKGWMYRLWYAAKIRWNVLLGMFLMASRFRTSEINWGTYKQRLKRNTDFKKFDDKIRQVLSGSVAQRRELEKYLEQQYRERKLVYGIHTASHALITCLLFNYNDAHVHLVDADNGGYASAAAMMKLQLKQLERQKKE